MLKDRVRRVFSSTSTVSRSFKSPIETNNRSGEQSVIYLILKSPLPSNMSEQATEIALLPARPDVDLDNPETKAGWESALRIITKQPGFISLYWGRQIEHHDIIELVISTT